MVPPPSQCSVKQIRLTTWLVVCSLPLFPCQLFLELFLRHSSTGGREEVAPQKGQNIFCFTTKAQRTCVRAGSGGRRGSVTKESLPLSVPVTPCLDKPCYWNNVSNCVFWLAFLQGDATREERVESLRAFQCVEFERPCRHSQ